MKHFSELIDVSHYVPPLLEKTGVIFTRDDIVAAFILTELAPDLRKQLLEGVEELIGKRKSTQDAK